ncbi:MAG: oligopeptide transporter, OPT family [Bacteroidetes bacterium]|nr:MAG: oligopeptide transporter, OPT family [Bacteroidota bacterium]
MEHISSTPTGLPDNAYKELKQGETYRPIMDPTQPQTEITPWSVGWGLVMAVLFSAAAAYSGLKIGQVFEAAIPIAILAVGISTLFKKKNAMGQNVMIQSIGAASGVVVAGAIFTIPALYILDLPANFFQMFAASSLGGFLGILFLIPFRKYFVRDMHGKLPFPEATATTEILVAGEKGGAQAKVLVISGFIGGLFDFAFSAFGAWSEVISTRMIGWGAELADKLKIVAKLNISAMIFGLGYIVGLKYSAIIAAGSFLSWFVLVPLVSWVGDGLASPLGATATKLISAMSAEEIFRSYVRQIGIGGIAMAGVIGIIRSRKIIAGAVSLATKEIGKGGANAQSDIRWQTDLKMSYVVMGLLLTAVLAFAFFYGDVVGNAGHALGGVLIVLVVSFLFTTVAANAIAITGNNPVSGMTLMTLILSSFILVRMGLSGSTGMVSALLIGGVVCTALSVAGGFITDLKVGYWLGSTPKKQESWKFVGILLAAASTAAVIYILNETFGFKDSRAMPAPQANAMAAIIQPLMSNVEAPWVLYLVGAMISLILVMVGISPLAFALGMYLPQELNTPLVLGGIVAWWVTTRTKNEKLNNARFSRGTLIASGFIAGGSLFGVLNALLRFFKKDWGETMYAATWAESHPGEIVGLIAFVGLFAYALWDTMRAKEED